MSIRPGKRNPFWRVLQWVAWAVFRVRYVAFDRLRDRWQLRDYVDDIKNIEVLSDTSDGVFAIFVYYEPGETVSDSVQRIIQTLSARKVNILLACNHDLSDQQRSFFNDHCHSIILRGNQGFDFGCYKDTVKHMVTAGLTPDRLLILNDSVFYASRGLGAFVDALLGEEDVIVAYENWGEEYHLQSFALSISAHVFASRSFLDFWRNYVPSNNRVLAIDLGEKGLTRAMLNSARTTKVIYSIDKLHTILTQSGGVDETMLEAVIPWPAKGRLKDAPRNPEDRIVEVCGHLGSTSTIHSGAYFFPKYMASPLFKKDLVYRRRFSLWEVGVWTKDLLPEDEREQFLNQLRLKGDASGLSLLDRFKFTYGLK